jgi:hypothetical protein
MVLRFGQLGSKIQVVAQRVVGRQLTQAFSAAAVQAFQISEK